MAWSSDLLTQILYKMVQVQIKSEMQKGPEGQMEEREKYLQIQQINREWSSELKVPNFPFTFRSLTL